MVLCILCIVINIFSINRINFKQIWGLNEYEIRIYLNHLLSLLDHLLRVIKILTDKPSLVVIKECHVPCWSRQELFIRHLRVRKQQPTFFVPAFMCSWAMSSFLGQRSRSCTWNTSRPPVSKDSACRPRRSGARCPWATPECGWSLRPAHLTELVGVACQTMLNKA